MNNSSLSNIFEIIQAPQSYQVKNQKLVDAILQLSDFFIDNPEDLTPWDEEFCKLAYRYYYLPLNYIRVENVIKRGQEVNFFNQITSTVDWGAGPGTASLAMAANKSFKLQKQILIDQSNHVTKNFSDLHQYLKSPEYSTKLSLKNLNIDYKKSLLMLSYSLTEMQDLPEGFFEFDHIMILEPATQDDGRKLLELRQKLIEKKYYLWAPCVHQQSCPLLTHSKSDWCHDRYHVKAPQWFWDVEKNLPFKNKTITTSYLLISKNPPPPQLALKARTTGDSMTEKGKTRQLICRSTEREFLTWMHKEIEPETIARGELLPLPAESETTLEKKSNELRVKTALLT